MTSSPDAASSAEALAERLFAAGLAAGELLTVYLGDRLGLYEALASAGTVTAGEFAARTGTQERLIREWLEQQATAGILDVARADDDPAQRVYALSPAHAAVLTQPEDLNYLAPFARFIVGIAQQLPALQRAYRDGGGVSWAAFGPDVIEGQAAFNRPAFIHQLGSEWLPAVPELHARLQAGARVADVACGGGWSTIAIARAYPRATVDGYDLDESSIAMANANIAEAGLSDRVRAYRQDIATVASTERYDLVTIFEALHDLSDPVGALRAMRAMLAPGGVVLVMDERVSDAFTAPGDEIERLMYMWSVTLCLPNALADEPSAATGTVMRLPTLERYTREAGFASGEVLPIDHPMFRFYLLRP
jgi:SAM-dependent methyltransferase